MADTTIRLASAVLAGLFCAAAVTLGGCSDEQDPEWEGGNPAFSVTVTATPDTAARAADTYYLWLSSASATFSDADLYSLTSGSGEVFVGQDVGSDLDLRVEAVPGLTVYEWHETETEWHDESPGSRTVHLMARIGGSTATGHGAHVRELIGLHHGPELELNGGPGTDTVATLARHGIRYVANYDSATSFTDNVDGAAVGGSTEPAPTGALHEVELHLHMPELSRIEDPQFTSETEMVRGEVMVTFTDVRCDQGRFVAWTEDLDANGDGLGTFRYQQAGLEQTITHLGAGIVLPEHELTVKLRSGAAQTLYAGGYPAAIVLDSAGYDMSVVVSLGTAALGGHGGGHHAEPEWESQNLPGFSVEATILNELTNGSTTVTLAPIWSEEHGLYYGANVTLPLEGQVAGTPPTGGGGGGGHGH